MKLQIKLPAIPRRRLAVACLALAPLAQGCRSEVASGVPGPMPNQVQIGGVRWYVDYEAALEVARREDKAMWVHFGENPG